MSEVEFYLRKLSELGIPEEVMFYPKDKRDETTNTLMEAQQFISFIRKHGLDPKTVILVSRSVHQLRATLTFRKQCPAVEFISCPSEETLNGELVPRLLSEIERIQSYGLKGDLVNVKIPTDVLEASVKLGELFKRF